MFEAMSSPAQVARGTRVPALPAPLAMLFGALSVQLGGAVAVHAFARSTPLGVTFLRSAFAAVILLLVARSLPRTRGVWRAALPLGVVMACMNACFYEAIERLPLGAAVTIEFWGPIAVAVVTSHRRTDLIWVALALAGVSLLGEGFADAQPAGLAFILAAGGLWALYIVLCRRVARTTIGVAGLVPACALSAATLSVPGLASARASLLDLRVIALCALLGLLGTAIPYAIEMYALRRLPARTFSVLLSVHPAVAALVGAAALSQGLGLRDAIAIACVVAASTGALASAARARAAQ
jgi:inner membrane transporter RhtA